MIVLSFDTDHMSEGMMETFLRSVLPNDVTATFFCTQPYVALSGSRHEVAIHPILDHTHEWERVTTDLRAQVGGAVTGVRAHSCAYQQKYGVWLGGQGFDYVSQVTVPAEIDLPAYRHPWGVWEVPIRYMDNMDLWAFEKTSMSDRAFDPRLIDMAIAARGVFCFDFHPVHLLLNTSSFGDYEAWARAGRPQLLTATERDAYGVRDFFFDLVARCRETATTIATCREAVGAAQGAPRALELA